MKALINLKDLTLKETTDLITSLGAKPFRGKQVVDWVFKKGVTSVADMANLPGDLKEALTATAFISNLKILRKQQSSDGTVKYLFGLGDDDTVESVLLRHNYGNSVCVSTQVGCKMGCGFCASTIGGFQRNLTPGEIYDQVLTIEKQTGSRVSSVVIMGSGEPLDNYDNVLKFIRLVSAPYALNIGMRHITLSTCGLVPAINKLAQEGLSITLSISLHAPDNELRNQLMPINRRHPLEQLIPACHEYTQKTGRRVSFEYILIQGVNDSAEQALCLSRLLKGLLGHVNLIPVNPVKEKNWFRPSDTVVRNFQRVLEENKIPVTLRREMGTDIDAACGQLRRSYSLAGKTGGNKDGILE